MAFRSILDEGILPDKHIELTILIVCSRRQLVKTSKWFVGMSLRRG